MTQTSFDDTNQAKKGRQGEDIVARKIAERGYIVYRPETPGAHAFDFLAIKDKTECMALDVKTKARRTYYPDTGINESHHRVYMDFSLRHSMPFWIVFVDEQSREIYGNEISELDKPREVGGRTYPWIHNGIRYWPLKAMIPMGRIRRMTAGKLKGLSSRNYDYKEAHNA